MRITATSSPMLLAVQRNPDFASGSVTSTLATFRGFRQNRATCSTAAPTPSPTADREAGPAVSVVPAERVVERRLARTDGRDRTRPRRPGL